MAEFTEVMRHAKRMCDAIVGGRCHECTLWRPETESCSLYGDDDGVDYADMERRVMAWAAEHPAPRYPTWREWQNSTFPNRHRDVSPCEFDDARRFNCALMKCDECMDEPIPADIAAKLGIKPINEGCENCKYTDKAEDEEPCVKCRHTQPEGSARWTETSDLWKEVPDE